MKNVKKVLIPVISVSLIGSMFFGCSPEVARKVKLTKKTAKVSDTGMIKSVLDGSLTKTTEEKSELKVVESESQIEGQVTKLILETDENGKTVLDLLIKTSQVDERILIETTSEKLVLAEVQEKNEDKKVKELRQLKEVSGTNSDSKEETQIPNMVASHRKLADGSDLTVVATCFGNQYSEQNEHGCLIQTVIDKSVSSLLKDKSKNKVIQTVTFLASDKMGEQEIVSRAQLQKLKGEDVLSVFKKAYQLLVVKIEDKSSKENGDTEKQEKVDTTEKVETKVNADPTEKKEDAEENADEKKATI